MASECHFAHSEATMAQRVTPPVRIQNPKKKPTTSQPQQRKYSSLLLSISLDSVDVAAIMFLWKRLAVSFLSFLALLNLRPLSVISKTNGLFETYSSTNPPPFGDETVMEMESVDIPSLDPVNKSQAFREEQAGNANLSHQALNSSKVNTTRISQRPRLSVSMEATDSTLTVSPMPSDPKLYFIHVGKAGGLTLNTILDIQGKWRALGCVMKRSKQHHGNNRKRQLLQGHANNVSGSVARTLPPCYVPQPPYMSQLSQHMVSHLHLYGARFSRPQRQWLLNHTNTFLFNLRDPIDRIVSAYNFHRHNFAKTTEDARKFFYHVCFPNGMEDLINQLRRYRRKDNNNNDNDPNATNTTKCQLIGIKTLQEGKKVGGGNHFHYNYGYYARKTIDLRPNHSVAVIRTEYMWDDIIALDKALGGTGEFPNVGGKVSHGSEKWTGTQKYNSYLSAENLELLCCFLHSELEVYQRLILLAANLDHVQKRETLSSTLRHCQIDYAGDPVSQPFPWGSYYNTTCLPMMKDIVSVAGLNASA